MTLALAIHVNKVLSNALHFFVRLLKVVGSPESGTSSEESCEVIGIVVRYVEKSFLYLIFQKTVGSTLQLCFYSDCTHVLCMN